MEGKELLEFWKKQKLAIEYKEQEKILKRRKQAELESRERLKKAPIQIFINSRKGKFQDKFVLEHEITTEDIDREIELGFITNDTI